MTESKLFCVLPDYVCTPDGMAIDRYGNLVLSCPNYAQDDLSGCVVKIDKDGNVKKWFDVPVHPETGVARNMGIAFDDDWNVYLCDNQGWSEREELLFKGRVLKVTVDDDGNILKSTVVAEHMEHPNGIRIRGGYMYVTQSYLHPVHREDGKLVSCVYRFRLDEENVQITNTLEDPNIFATFITHNPVSYTHLSMTVSLRRSIPRARDSTTRQSENLSITSPGRKSASPKTRRQLVVSTVCLRYSQAFRTRISRKASSMTAPRSRDIRRTVILERVFIKPYPRK